MNAEILSESVADGSWLVISKIFQTIGRTGH